MIKKLANSSSTKSCSVISAIDFGVKAVPEDVKQGSTEKWNDSWSGAETVDVIGGSRSFDYDGDMEKQITTKPKSEDELFKEMMNGCIARCDNGKKILGAELRREAVQEIGNSELEDNATLVTKFLVMTTASSIATIREALLRGR